MKVGDRVVTPELGTLTLTARLGGGSQGEVFAVAMESGGEYALKRFHDRGRERGRALRTRLEELAQRPAPDQRLAWPLKVGLLEEEVLLLMPLIEGRFRSLSEIIFGDPVPPPSDSVLATAALELGRCFRSLHLSGLVYRDLNYGGPRIDLSTGEVRVCDVDNTGVAGASPEVYTLGMAAPELLRGGGRCTTRTDDHAMAVLFFLLFVRNHPLAGAREARYDVLDEVELRQLYAAEPLFIFDAKDQRNAPVLGIHDTALRNWPRLPGFVRDRFAVAFGPGLSRPELRPTDLEWMRVFARMRDTLFPCSQCGLETAPGEEELNATAECYQCNARIPLPPRLVLSDKTAMLLPGREFFGYHAGRTADYETVIGDVITTPGGHLGLRNLGRVPISYRAPEGWKTLSTGAAATLRPSLEVRLDTQRARVVWGGEEARSR